MTDNAPNEGPSASEADRGGLASYLPDAPTAASLPEAQANRLRWNRKRRGHYEVWYITVAEGPGGTGFWFRYTIHVPTTGDPAVCAVWAMVFDPDRPDATPTGMKVERPIDDLEAKDAPFGVAVGELGSFDGRRARGAVGEGASRIEWDFELSSGGVHRHFGEGLYRWGFAKTCVNSANVDARADGKIVHGDREYHLRGAAACQSHVFGSRHALSWAWSHCNEFAEDGSAVLEVVSARIKKLGMTMPAATMVLVRWTGGEVLVSTLLRSMGVRSTVEPGRLFFEAKGGGSIVRAEITAPPERCLTLPYADPDGTPIWVTSSVIAHANVEILTPGAGAIQLSAEGTATLELGGRERDERVERLLDGTRL